MDENTVTDREVRFAILKYLKRAYDVNPHALVLGEELETDKFTKTIVARNVKYLKEKGLVKADWYLGGNFSVAINSYGIDELEKETSPKQVQVSNIAVAEPQQKEPHTITYNTNIKKMVGSQIQQGSPHATQTYSANSSDDFDTTARYVGAVLTVIGLILDLLVFKTGWNLNGIILITISLPFDVFGLGSIILPKKFGKLAVKLYESISKK